MPEYESMDELRADCEQIPSALRTYDGPLPMPRGASSWIVDDSCLATVDDLDEYV